MGNGMRDEGGEIDAVAENAVLEATAAADGVEGDDAGIDADPEGDRRSTAGDQPVAVSL